MYSATFNRVLAALLVVCLTNLGLAHSAGAAVIGTPLLVQLEDRTAAVSRVQSSLAREDVRKAMVQLGVDPEQAQERVLALTDAEVAQLDQDLAKLPAGGDGGWILLVIVLTVLIVLFATGKLKLN
jgi:type IV secretory pathway VirJ component